MQKGSGMTQRLYIEDIASRLEARPDVYVTAAAELLRSLAKEIDTTKQAKEDIAAAWVAGYYHAGYAYDGAYADKMSDEFAAEWCKKAAQPYTVADCKASEERWSKKIEAQPARPDVEPVGYFYFDRDDFTYKQAKDKISFPSCIKLYTAPPDTEAMRQELERVKGERDAMEKALRFMSLMQGDWEQYQSMARKTLADIAAQGGGE